MEIHKAWNLLTFLFAYGCRVSTTNCSIIDKVTSTKKNYIPGLVPGQQI